MTTACTQVGPRLLHTPIAEYNGILSVDVRAYDRGGEEIQVDGEKNRLVDLGPIISLSASADIIAQIQTAFDNTVHITPFGDKPGQLRVTVLDRPASCTEDATDVSAIAGMVAMKFYRTYRYVPGDDRSYRPMRISLGEGDYETSLNGILFGCEMSLTAEQGVASAVLTFVVWLED